jgi:hypothetical protein
VNEQELRGLIRESIARHLGGDPGRSSFESSPAVRGSAVASQNHASHVLLPLHRGGDGDDGACLIEPAVRCNHCGYCISFGH